MEILANTADLQAVRCASHLTGIVFWKPGRIACAPGLEISAGEPCLVLADTAAPSACIFAADPTEKLPTLTITVNGAPKAIQLPRNLNAGQSIQLK